METGSYKERLLGEKEKLTTELQEVGRKNPSNPGDWEAKPQDTGLEADPNIVADQMEGYGENAAILNDLEKRYNEVEEALARVSAGTYGTCVIGGEPIEEDRLHADPAAPTCKAHLNS